VQHFHRDYGPGIFRQLLAATWGNHDLASDALQQTYLRVARHARPCDSELMFSSWLRVVTRSALNDCRRRRRSFWQLLQRRQDDPTEDSTSGEEEDRLLSALETVLAQIGSDERELLEAKYFNGASVRSLAAKLLISEKAVESRLTRARTALRERLVVTLSRHE